MSKKTLFSTVLALSIGASLTACAGLPTGTFAGLTSNLNPQQQAAVKSMVSDYLVASQMNQDMSDADAMSESSMGTMALGVEVSARASASVKLKERMERFKERSKQRIEHKRGAMKTQVETTTEGNTVTKKMEFEHKNGAKKQIIVKVYADETLENLIEANFHLEQQHKNGMSLVIDRSRVVDADGNWTIAYKATFTRKDEKVKTVAWTRVEAADGSQTGTGTITRFDGTVVQITFTKSADGVVVTRTVDSAAQVEAEVTQDEAAVEADVTITNQAGQVTGEATVSVEDAEPSEQ